MQKTIMQTAVRASRTIPTSRFTLFVTSATVRFPNFQFQPTRSFNNQKGGGGGGKPAANNQKGGAPPAQKKQEISIKVFGIDSEIADGSIASFKVASLSDIDSIREHTLKKAEVGPEEACEVQWFDKETEEWIPLEELQEMDLKSMNGLSTRVSFQGEDESDEPSDYDNMKEEDDMVGQDESQLTVYRTALADLVDACGDAKFDALNSNDAAVKKFVLDQAKRLDSVQDAIISDPVGLTHLVTCLQYPFVHEAHNRTDVSM